MRKNRLRTAGFRRVKTSWNPEALKRTLFQLRKLKGGVATMQKEARRSTRIRSLVLVVVLFAILLWFKMGVYRPSNSAALLIGTCISLYMLFDGVRGVLSHRVRMKRGAMFSDRSTNTVLHNLSVNEVICGLIGLAGIVLWVALWIPF
jgi:hypothetical protein